MPAPRTPAEKVRLLTALIERGETTLQATLATELGVTPTVLATFKGDMIADHGDLPAALEAATAELSDEDERAAAAADCRARCKTVEAARQTFNAERGETVSWSTFKGLLARASDRGLDGSTPNPPPPGQVVKGLSTLATVDPETGDLRTRAVWTKTATDKSRVAEAFELRAQEIVRGLRAARPVEPPAGPRRDALLNVYTIADAHIAALATPAEGGDAWKIREAERVLIGCFRLMIRRSPPAARAAVVFLGDTGDYDGLVPVTPRSHHVLNVDGRFGELVRATQRVQDAVIAEALRAHQSVAFVDAEANHDPASAHWRRAMWRRVYRDEPRLGVIEHGDLPFYHLEHGACFVGWYHGHDVRADDLPMVFADEFAPAWGRTTKRFIHTGHRHKRSADGERRGADLIEHPTLAGRNAWATGIGKRAMRRAMAHFYHHDHGDVGSVTVSPDMLTGLAA